ncbi:hypothetical protein GCM10023210_09980 [Chryseobacterium ginsengisoli]|uniref:Uncharacterized protein n=2 Tax=Chryseobacterium ginsengisoli TaxID=363853 RepID=A0ABP9M150_9FLAO
MSATVSAQVGVNTSTPNTTMDVSAKRNAGGAITDFTQTFGLQAPRVTRTELTTNLATYSTNQQGALIYITDVSGGTATGQRINIDEAGYYSFDGSVWQKVLFKNIYNADGSLVGSGTRRTLTVNGKELSFEGTSQRTYWSANGSMNQSANGGTVGSLSIYGGNDSNLFIQQFQNSNASISATRNSTGLSLSTHFSNNSAPITLNTSPGGGTTAVERMRVTGEGNVGISTNDPQVTLDVAGTPATATILDGIRAPRLTGDQLRAKTYTNNQLAAIVYITAADTAPAGQTINVTSEGYYYFDGAAWQKIRANDVNIYSNNGLLTSNRTLTNNGFSLIFTGTDQSTTWTPTGSMVQRGFGTTSKRASAILSSDDNDSNGVVSRLQLFQDPEAVSQIMATNDSRGLNIGSTSTTTAAPITFVTSAGSNANGTQKMIITGTGNIGINTGTPTEKLDNNGITRLRTLPLNGSANAINTNSSGNASASQDQTFTATRTVVADANGVLGYVTGLPQTAGSSGTISIGETVSRVYSLPASTANTSTFNLKTYVTANSLQALPQLDGLEMNLQGVNSTYYDPRVYNIATGTQLVSYQTFATQVNENETSLNNSLTSGNFVQVDANNIVFWTNSAAEVITTNLQVQIDTTTYRWYEFKWWCMEVGTEKKIFLSVTRKG